MRVEYGGYIVIVMVSFRFLSEYAREGGLSYVFLLREVQETVSSEHACDPLQLRRAVPPA